MGRRHDMEDRPRGVLRSAAVRASRSLSSASARSSRGWPTSLPTPTPGSSRCLTRVETTLDGVNSELDKVDQITGSVAEIVKAAEQTTTALHTAVATPIRKIAGLVVGARESIKSFVAARRKGYY